MTDGRVLTTHISLAVVVVNYRTAHLVRGLAESFLVTAAVEGDLFCIVDNSEVPESFEELRGLFAAKAVELIVDYPGANVGFAAACNRGLEAAGRGERDVVWFLNPDTTIETADRGEFGELARSGPGIALVGTAVVDRWPEPRDGVSYLGRWTGRVVKDRRGALPFVHGNSLIVDPARLRALGGLNANYFLYFEEADLALRAQRVGGRILVARKTLVRHAGGGATKSSRSGPRSPIAVFHAQRSCLLFFRTYMPSRLPVVALLRLAWAARLAFRSPSIGRAAFAGTLAGLLGRNAPWTDAASGRSGPGDA